MDNINTEAIFYSTSYTTKSGWKVTFALPDDIAAKQLDDGGSGQRYMIALVPIDENEQPKPIKRKTSRAQMAGILCNDQRFQKFMRKTYEFRCFNDEQTAEAVRAWCKVESRAELDSNVDRGMLFDVLRTEFDVYTGRIAAPR